MLVIRQHRPCIHPLRSNSEWRMYSLSQPRGVGQAPNIKYQSNVLLDQQQGSEYSDAQRDDHAD